MAAIVRKEKLSPLTRLLQSTDKREPNEARLERQKYLLAKIATSSEQYAYLAERVDPDKLEAIYNQLDNYKYGMNAAAPSLCMGPSKCPFFHACPLGNGIDVKEDKTGKTIKIPLYDDISIFPIGKTCILEQMFMETRLTDYIHEFDVDPAKPSELALINDLSLVDLHKNRCILILAAGDSDGEGMDFMKLDKMWHGETGLQTGLLAKEHPVMTILDKLEKRRHKILEELVATRRVKASTAAKFGNLNQSSSLTLEIEKLRKAIETKSARSIIDVDSNEVIEEPVLSLGIENEDILELD